MAKQMAGETVSLFGRAAPIGVAVSLLAGCASGSLGSSARSPKELPPPAVATAAVARPGDLLANELPAISLAERTGLPLAYATDVALDLDPHLLDGARGLVSMAHDEYWSTKMRAAVTAARDRGVNVAFLGANAVFRHIRLEEGPVSDGADRADRQEVNYKRQFEDPYNGRDDAEVTVDWREPPVPRPESTLTGTFYECNPVHANLTVTDPSSWLWAGIARAGAIVPAAVGSEYDRVNPGVPTPAGIEVLTHSPVTCRHPN